MCAARIDLNCDAGESFGAWRIEISREVWERISSANIACGFHAGDPLVMEEAVNACRRYRVAPGAHPGFPDVLGFGRREMLLSPTEARDYTLYQAGALQAFCTSVDLDMQHIKPHGALYNMAAYDERLAGGIIEALLALRPRPILLALSGSRFARMGEEAGLRVGHEVFADRAYNLDGTLVSRSRAGAVMHDPEAVVRQAIQMVTEGRVDTIDGGSVSLRADSICVHGDNPRAGEIVVRLAEGLNGAGVVIAPLHELV